MCWARALLHQVLGFEVTPVLELRVALTSTDCTVEMLSCRVRACDRCLIHRLVLPCENFSDSSSSFPPVFYLKDPA